MPSDEELTTELRKLQRRIKRFSGVVFDPERRQWRAAFQYNRKPLVVGYYDTEIIAFRAWKMGRALRPTHVDKFESPARVGRLLRLASCYPAVIRPDEIIGSSLCPLRNSLWRDA